MRVNVGVGEKMWEGKSVLEKTFIRCECLSECLNKWVDWWLLMDVTEGGGQHINIHTTQPLLTPTS